MSKILSDYEIKSFRENGYKNGDPVEGKLFPTLFKSA